MWQYPKLLISGHGDRSLSEAAEFGAVRTVCSHWGEVTGWLVLVTAAVGMQNACRIPLLGTPEDFDGTLPVFAKPQRLLLSHFFCLSSTLPFLCVQRDGIHVFQVLLLSSSQYEYSRRLLDVPRVGVLCP